MKGISAVVLVQSRYFVPATRWPWRNPPFITFVIRRPQGRAQGQRHGRHGRPPPAKPPPAQARRDHPVAAPAPAYDLAPRSRGRRGKLCTTNPWLDAAAASLVKSGNLCVVLEVRRVNLEAGA